MATAERWTRIITTLPQPLPFSTERIPTRTSRLLIRPLALSDLNGFHELARTHEVMKWTAAGHAHTSHEETRKRLDEFLAPNDTKTFNCAICLRDTGEFVGIGGVHRFSRIEGLHGVDPESSGYGWPELGYLLKQEYWGRGLATEFVTAFLNMWDQLQRASTELSVNVKSLVDGDYGDESSPAKEALVAIVDPANGASQRILQKCGFEEFDKFTEKHREDPDKSLQLLSFRYFPNSREATESINSSN